MSRLPLTMVISSAGRRVMLLEAFRAGARALGIDLTIVATDMAPEWSAACRIADHRVAVPCATDPGFLEQTVAICRQHDATLIVPTIDPELPILAAAARQLAAEGIHVVADPDLVAISNDKLLTARWLASIGVPVPLTQMIADVRADAPMIWPAIVKPTHGSASRGISTIRTCSDMAQCYPEPMIVQQKLSGDEWTINAFVDRGGTLRAVVPHQRINVRAGEVEKGITRRRQDFTEVAERIVHHLPSPHGPFCFQAIVQPDGTFGVFEINARFGGGYPLADHAGATFAKWLLAEAAGLPPAASDTWTDGLMMLRYDAAVFA